MCKKISDVKKQKNNKKDKFSNNFLLIMHELLNLD